MKREKRKGKAKRKRDIRKIVNEGKGKIRKRKGKKRE